MFVRHGQSKWNASNQFTGWVDVRTHNFWFHRRFFNFVFVIFDGSQDSPILEYRRLKKVVSSAVLEVFPTCIPPKTTILYIFEGDPSEIPLEVWRFEI